MKSYDKMEKISYSKTFHGILEIFLLLKRSNGISELFCYRLKERTN